MKRSDFILLSGVLIPAAVILGVGYFVHSPDSTQPQKKDADIKSVYSALDKVSLRDAAAKIHGGNVDDMVQRLEQRLTINPNDADGWRVLGWSHYRRQNFKKSADAYSRAAELDSNSAILKSLHGEALVAAAKGRITPEAVKVFKSALSLDTNDVRSNFFLGQAKLQEGDARSAIDMWIALLKTAQPGAGWAGDLRTRISEVANDAGIDVSRLLPAPLEGKTSPPAASSAKVGPTAADIENAQKLSPEARRTMAQDMVERLAKRLQTAPDDPDGWIMLMRSRMVLKQPDKAKAAMKQALETFAHKPDVKQQITQAAKALFSPPAAPGK